jgi:hypothetical protein
MRSTSSAAIQCGSELHRLLRRGFDTATIMRAGGWKSVNVLARYLEQAEHNVWT